MTTATSRGARRRTRRNDIGDRTGPTPNPRPATGPHIATSAAHTEVPPATDITGHWQENSSLNTRSVRLGGTRVDLMSEADAIDFIVGAASSQGLPPVAVVSANLDHIHHFGTRGIHREVISRFGDPFNFSLDQTSANVAPRMRGLSLLDGAPLVVRARILTGVSAPRLAGSDLIEPLLDRAELIGLRVGFLGGSIENQALLREMLETKRPQLCVAGWWAPSRDVLADPVQSRSLAEEINLAHVDMLVVGLGKPRQEVWIASYGNETGAGVLLAFGAVVDFLAGRVRRAPHWMSASGLEWLWRLALEPRRLGRRYLLQGPAALRVLLSDSSL